MSDAGQPQRSSGGGGPLLVLNAGSTGLKASVHSEAGALLWRGSRSWPEPSASAAAEPPGAPLDGGIAAALDGWLEAAVAPWSQGENSAGQPCAPLLVGHRVVHGGDRFTAPSRITEAVLEEIGNLTPLAPLHNPPALAAIRWALGRWPRVPQWACFDTAFHATLPVEARTYALPRAWRRQGLRRYGFHGLNHQHVAESVAGRFGPEGAAGPLRLISCHLGGGCSLCAIRGGRSIATTMGFTPLEGLVMASRSGSVDPGLLLHQLRQGMGVAELEQALQREGGLLGLSELSGSMEVLRAAAGSGASGGDAHAGAQLAIGVFRQRLLEGIGAMAACLGGVDVIALSGGIGEHDQALQQDLREALGWLGDVTLLVIPADEEGVIARSCLAAMAAGG